MDIRHIAPGFAVSPQLTKDDLAEAASLGFKTIVDIRPDGEVPDQPSSVSLEQAAHQIGLGFAYIPIAPGTLTEHHARELAQVFATMKHPVLAYCRTGARSEELWQQFCDLPPDQPKLEA